MKIFWIVIFLTFTNYFVQAQNYTREHLDSLYEKFVWLRTDNKSSLYNELIEVDPADRKCGFGIVSEIIHNLESFTTEQQTVLAKILQRPGKDTSMVSPSGFFRIHYDTTGNEVPNYNPLLSIEENAMQVALAADSSYNFEVNFLGYPPPPGDSIKNMNPLIFGGDNRYDIYITRAQDNYGFTQPESFLGDQKYTTHIQIHYNYVGNFYTHGLNAMRVTVAHELHHAIQIGNYTGDKTGDDLYFYEMTSTSMEEFVYDDVNDYYGYLHSYFNNPGQAFALNNGYNLAHWNIFLKDKSGYNIIKRQWELLPQFRALNAIVTSLNEAGTTFGSKFIEFSAWTFFTNYRTIAGKYFEEAANYPLIRSINTIDFNSQPVNGEAKPTSNNFITFINSTDTLVAIISNSDFISGVNNINDNFDYQYILSKDSTNGSVRLTDNYFAKLNVNQPSFWTDAEVLNNQLVRLGTILFPVNLEEDLYAYPNPFFYNKRYSNFCNCIEILLDPKNESAANLNIYSSAMELVYSSTLPVKLNFFGKKVLQWDIRGLDENLDTGIYIYAIKIGDETSAGKLVIFNE